jgi:hypothetical protein
VSNITSAKLQKDVKKEEVRAEVNSPELMRRWQWSGSEFIEEDPISPGNGRGEEEDR